MTHDVNRSLHKTFITPIDREQIHSLINNMDDVADLLQDSAETMALYDVHHMTEEITRLTDLGVPSYLISATVIGVLAQRLVRTLCPHCKQPDDGLDPDTLAEAIDHMDWLEKGVAEWRSDALTNAARARVAEATARIAVDRLQALLKEFDAPAEQHATASAARDWLLSIGSEPT